MPPRKILVIGANGQLGRALREAYDGDARVEFAGRAEFDLASEDSFISRNWRNYSTIINAAAYTAVDAAETPEGRTAAWAANVTGVAGSPGPPSTTTSPWCTSPPTTSSTARRDVHPEDEAVLAAGRLRPDQGGGRCRRERRAPPLHRAHLLGDR